MVMEVVDEDMDETGMSCTDHPYKNNTPGGICAFCLQDKLGKLVSSSFPSSIFPASATSSISSPSRRHPPPPPPPDHVLIKDNINNNNSMVVAMGNSSNNTSIIFQRSRSTAVNRRPSRVGGGGFWSFLALNRVRPQFRQGSLRERRDFTSNTNNNNNGGDGDDDEDCYSRGEDDERKVSRSRSVGCGSRSFSGDFFERISTGFGDCTLRRVESQREGGKANNNKMTKMKNTPVHASAASSSSAAGGGGDRVRCGGIFGGFSSSSSSSSSTNWGAAPPAAVQQAARGSGHWRSRSWGWALASPMRVFSKPKRKATANVTPNLNAIPSILAVGG